MLQEMLRLQPVDEAQIDSLLDLYRSCEDFLALGPQAFASREMVLADLAYSRKNGGVFYGIFLDPGGELAGVLDLISSGYGGQVDQAYLELLMLASGQRGKGLGKRVLEAAEGMSRASGARILFLDVQTNNPGGIQFWQNRGFTIISGPNLQTDTTITYTMQKTLTPVGESTNMAQDKA